MSPITPRRSFTASLVAFLYLGAATLGAACGGGDRERIAYRPISFGENGACYYLHDPAEAFALQAAGLCDPSWVPAVMPGHWHQQYYPYYASPAYVRVYVPAPVRDRYVAAEKNWGKANKTAISQASKGARYRGSNGKEVPAERIGATKYGAGNRFGDPGAKFGGGSGRGETKTTGKATTPASRPVTAKPSTPATSKPTPATSKPATPSKRPTVKSPPKSPSSKSPSPKSPSPKPSSSGGSKSFGGGSRGGSYGGKR